ncbi:ribosome-associated protein [Tamilnaduibacter salinus]|uniref:Dual-action ribosomal maturation protein DarP n=1 Tax=Tamilnaduibacter salinus TaxID=1484056 RepID=A0A2A2I2H9_9GAMM|nr:ribosome biogenesis factor YjgA [Tamilnaduibacter salinus]PAV25345.1 hypothetical protein CF392_11570 [Tamilnaduibacter salinus]PVY70754.1 ribosome-associated protein [Tamilnaduibacter salinus]
MSDEHDRPDDPEESGTEWVSKTQRKRDMEELQRLGRRLTELQVDQAAGMPMSDRLRDAVAESQRIRKREARRRHLQYIGKLMREEEHLDDLIRGIEALDAGSAEHTRRHHLAERWRERLIGEGNEAMSEFIAYCPETDVQHLRNLVRNAKKERQDNRNIGQAKKLFRYLRECIDEQEN